MGDRKIYYVYEMPIHSFKFIDRPMLHDADSNITEPYFLAARDEALVYASPKITELTLPFCFWLKGK